MNDTLGIQKFDKVDFFINIFGTNDVTYVVSGLIFSIIGILLSRYFHFRLKGKRNPATPDKFDWGFMIKDNLVQLIVSQVVVSLCMRFSEEFFGESVTMWWALIYGLVSDKLVEVLSKISQGENWKDAVASVFQTPKNTTPSDPKP
jgi:hypothetical protein